MRGTTSKQRDAHGSRRAGRRRSLTTIAIAAAFALATVAAAYGSAPEAAGPDAAQRDLAQVRAAVAQYHTPERAEAAGWGLVPGLDHCFEHDELGGMGYHYIHEDRLGDPTLDPLRPEALVFVAGPNGQQRLGAVEYIVPVDLWDGPDRPSVLGQELDLLEPVPGVEVYGLHVWLFERNPDGMFAHWNPRVSC